MSFRLRHQNTKLPAVLAAAVGYRIVGRGSPLVLITGYSASMDNWDPALLDAIAKERTVVVFDNRGVASTSGETPGTYREMADDAAAFIRALCHPKVDILGFSIGGAIAQELLFNDCKLIRRCVLAASMPPGGKGILQSRHEIAAIAAKSAVELDDFLTLFFEQTEHS